MDTRAPRVADAIVATGLLVLGLLWAASLAVWDLGAGRPLDLWGYALLLAQVVPLVWRQRYPRAVVWSTATVWALTIGLGYEGSPAMIAMFVAIYGLGSLVPLKAAVQQAVVLLAAVLAWTAVTTIATDQLRWGTLVAMAIAVEVPFALGLADRRRRGRMMEIEVALARREQAGYEAAVDAVRAERARIARELHDVVAHEVTVMTLQAEGARRRIGAEQPELADALQTIAASGRKGLGEMQRMIGVLRVSEQEANERVDIDRALAAGERRARSAPQDDLVPMPSLAALPALVRQVQDSGLPITLEISGSGHVPVGVEVSAYRIVQEALTNAMKHAGPGAHAEVRVRRGADAVHLSVEDDGRGRTSDSVRVGGGHGLTGMAERVQALGGALSHGPRRGGGFQVHAVLPTSDDHEARADAFG